MTKIQKEIKYLGRDFSEFRKNLIDFSRTYFPNTYNDFNESSPGMHFIEMAAYVGDVLSHYTDANLKESLLERAEEPKNLYALAHTLGYQTKNYVAATVDVDVFQLIPANNDGGTAVPDYSYAMIINDGMVIESENNSAEFRTTQPLDFAHSSSQSPTEVTVYSVNDTTKEPEWYLLKKTTKAVSGEIKSSTFTFGDPKIYDKIVLTDSNIIEILDIVDSDNNTWSEVPYLAQDTIFQSVQNTAKTDPTLSKFRDSAPYLLKLKKTARRFITRVKDTNRLEIQFGAGISSDLDEEIIPNPDVVGISLPGRDKSIDFSLDPSNFLYTRTYGLAPGNTTLTVRYTTGLGVSDNVSANDLNKVKTVAVTLDETGLDTSLATTVKRSVAVTNPNPARGGASKETVDQVRNQAMSNFASQNRAVTKEDYMVRAYSLPPRFGSIAKAYVVQDDQLSETDQTLRIPNPFALNLYTLGFDLDGKLTQLNAAVKENLKTYLASYRMLTDGINIKDAFIINIGIDFEVVVLPNYNANEVVLRCIERLKALFNINKRQINEPIQLSKLSVELDRVEGVQTVSKVEVINKIDSDSGYSGNIYDIKAATRDGVIYPSLDPSCWEIKYPNTDIRGRSVGV